MAQTKLVPFTAGSLQMTLNSATTVFPTDGIGGSAASAAASFPITGVYLVEALVIKTAPAGTDAVTIQLGDATAAVVISVLQTSPVGSYIPIGGLNGYQLNEGFSAKRSDATAVYTLYFRRIA